MKTKRRKIVLTVLLSLLLILLAVAVYFFQFQGEYRLTVPYRPNFQEIAPHIYMNKGNAMSAEEALAVFEEAKARDTAFFGEMHALDDVMLIICDDAEISRKIGEKDTHTYFFPQKKDWICISNEWYHVDVVAHELTHAELHSHMTTGDAQRRLPSWFDEGVATQNDYREQYSYENWIEQTDNGRNAVAIEDMDTPAEFYAGEAEDRRFRYLCARHEVAVWLEAHSVQELLELVDKVNAGEDFDTLYFAE